MPVLGAIRAANRAAGTSPQQKIRAYHGSPHPGFDRFSTDAIGTGEGVQMYGRGLYFADEEPTGLNYLNSLTPRNFDFENYLSAQYQKAVTSNDYVRAEMLERAMMHERPSDFRSMAKDKDYDEEYRQAAADMADEMESYRDSSGEPVNFGSMYEVDLNVSPDELLEYEAPLSEQSDYIKNVLRKNEDKLKKDLHLNLSIEDIINAPQQSGGGLLSLMRTERRGEAEAADYLRSLGIKGMRYKDAYSRHKSPDKQTNNYVIFDDNLIDIVKKYGVGLPAAAAIAGQPEEAEAGVLGTLLKGSTRLQRAQEQGFDLSNPYFHASKQDINEMKPGYDDGLVFVTPDPEFSNQWLGKGKFQERQGGTGAIEGVKAEKEKFLEQANEILKSLPEDQATKYYQEVINPKRQQLLKDEKLSDSAIYPVVTRTKKPFVPSKDVDVLDELFGEERMNAPFSSDHPTFKDALRDGNYLLYENKEVTDFLKSKGYDSMFLKESSGADKPFTTLAVFDSKDLRSINAQFDPNKTDSRNILASGAPVAAGLLGAGVMQPQEAEAAFFTSTANLIRLGMLTPGSAQNPIAVKSANTKYDKAMRESRAFRARETLRADIENQTETLDIGQRQLLDPNDLIGKVGVPVTGDTSVTGRTIQTIGGIDLDSPVQVEGGANFPLRYQDQGYGWASMESAAAPKQSNFAFAQKATEGAEPVGIFSAMGREAVNFSTPVAEALYLQTRKLPLAKKDVAEFDRYVRFGPKNTKAKKPKGVKNWVGLDHPDALDQLLGRGDYPREGAGEIRKQFIETMEMAGFRNRGFPIKEDVYAEVIEPDLQNAVVGDSGFSVFAANPDADVFRAPVHQSYDTIIPGQYVGGFDQNIPSRVMFPNIYSDVLDKAVDEKGRPLTEDLKLGSLRMRADLYQPLDEKWAEGVSTYLKNNPKKATAAGLLAAGNATAAEDEQKEFTGGMGVRVPTAPVEPVPFRAAMPSTTEPTTSEKAQGVLDAILNIGQAAVAPISNAPHTLIQALTSDRPTAQVRDAQQQRLDAMDYQPGELGQQYTDDFAKFVADQINQSRILNALGQSRILQTPINAIQQLPDRARLVGGSILDALPL